MGAAFRGALFCRWQQRTIKVQHNVELPLKWFENTHKCDFYRSQVSVLVSESTGLVISLTWHWIKKLTHDCHTCTLCFQHLLYARRGTASINEMPPNATSARTGSSWKLKQHTLNSSRFSLCAPPPFPFFIAVVFIRLLTRRCHMRWEQTCENFN